MSLHETILAALGDRGKGITAEQIAKAFAGWQLVDLGGAVIMTNGPEIHAAALPEVRGKWLTKRALRMLIAWVESVGVAQTSVMRDNQAGHAFVQRLGFIPVRDAPDRVFYELREVRHA